MSIFVVVWALHGIRVRRFVSHAEGVAFGGSLFEARPTKREPHGALSGWLLTPRYRPLTYTSAAPLVSTMSRPSLFPSVAGSIVEGAAVEGTVTIVGAPPSVAALAAGLPVAVMAVVPGATSVGLRTAPVGSIVDVLAVGFVAFALVAALADAEGFSGA